MPTVKGFQVQGYVDPVKYDYDYLENKLQLDPSLSQAGQAADAKAVGDAIAAISGGSGLTADIKESLLLCFSKVAWIDANGQNYYDALEAALYPPADLVSISAVFNQGQNIIYNTDSLDSLRQYLTVTALYEDTTVETVSSYTLAGTLEVGTSTITVSYGGKTTTFEVVVTEYVQQVNYVGVGNPTIVNHIATIENGKYVRTNVALSPSSSDSWKVRMKYKYNTLGTSFQNIIGGSDADVFAKTFILQENTSHQYIFYVSADLTNWTISNQYTATISFAVNTWYYLEFGYDGQKYYMSVKTGGWNGTQLHYGYKEYTSNVVIYNGKYIGFGVTSTVPGFDGEVDLTDCSIYLNDVLIWQGVG